MAPMVLTGSQGPVRQISESSRPARQISEGQTSNRSARSPRDREQRLLAAIERDYADELKRISPEWVLCKVLPRKVSEKAAPRFVDLAEVLGIPALLLGAMLAGKCRDQHIQVTRDRQQRFAEFVYANCSGAAFRLPESNLGSEFAKALALTMSFCSRYTELHLSGNSLGDEGARILAGLLQRTATLSFIDLSANDMSSKGVDMLLRAMWLNRSVRHLDLSSKTGASRNRFTKINGPTLEDLLTKNFTLQRLSLSACTLGLVGAQGLSRGLLSNQTLRSLDISQNDLGDKGACCMAAVLKECVLEDLNLAENRIGDEGLIALACSLGSLPNKVDGSSPVWQRAMEPAKAAAKYADSIGLLRRAILETDETEGQEELRNLEVAIGLTQAVRSAEVTLPKLKNLNISSNSGTSIGMRCMADALHVNDVLEKVYFDHCDHRDPDHGVYSLIVSLPVNTTLRHLGLSHALMGTTGLIYLAKAITANKALRSLNLAGNLLDQAAQAWSVTLGLNDTLKHLTMASCHLNDEAGVFLARGLARNEGLESFSLRDNGLRSSAEAFEEALTQNGTLVQLNLELNSIDFRFLTKIKQLLERNQKLREEGMPERYRTRINELTNCQKEVGRMQLVLVRNHHKKRAALWKQAAKVQKLQDEREADRQRQAEVEDQLQELLVTQEQVDQEVAVLESKLEALRSDAQSKMGVLDLRIEEVQDKKRVAEIQLQKMRRQLEVFEAHASEELAEVNAELERAMKAQHSANLLTTAAQRNLTTFTESLHAIEKDLAGGVNPRQRWTEMEARRSKSKPRTRTSTS